MKVDYAATVHRGKKNILVCFSFEPAGSFFSGIFHDINEYGIPLVDIKLTGTMDAWKE